MVRLNIVIYDLKQNSKFLFLPDAVDVSPKPDDDRWPTVDVRKGDNVDDEPEEWLRC